MHITTNLMPAVHLAAMQCNHVMLHGSCMRMKNKPLSLSYQAKAGLWVLTNISSI